MKALEFELVDIAAPNLTLKLGISEERMHELSKIATTVLMDNLFGGKSMATALQQYAKEAHTIQELCFLCKTAGLIEAQLTILAPGGMGKIPEQYILAHNTNDVISRLKKKH